MQKFLKIKNMMVGKKKKKQVEDTVEKISYEVQQNDKELAGEEKKNETTVQQIKNKLSQLED